MSSNSKIVLYSYWRSTCSWRVRIALAIKGIDYEYRAINLLKGEQLQAEYGNINPLHQLPTLCVDGEYLFQSLPIIEYLDAVYPDPPLLPKQPLQQAQVRAIAETIGSGIQPIQNLSVGKYASGLMGRDVKAEWNKHFITVGFQALEKTLQKTSGKYCFGDMVTIADIFLVPQVFNANRFGVDMASFPIIFDINDRLTQLPAFIKSHAQNQLDAM